MSDHHSRAPEFKLSGNIAENWRNFEMRFNVYAITHEKKLATVTAHRELTMSSQWAHRELTVTKMVTASRDWSVTRAVIELWPSRDHTQDAVIELWLIRDWAVTSQWLSCDLS